LKGFGRREDGNSMGGRRERPLRWGRTFRGGGTKTRTKATEKAFS